MILLKLLAKIPDFGRPIPDFDLDSTKICDVFRLVFKMIDHFWKLIKY